MIVIPTDRIRIRSIRTFLDPFGRWFEGSKHAPGSEKGFIGEIGFTIVGGSVADLYRFNMDPDQIASIWIKIWIRPRFV